MMREMPGRHEGCESKELMRLTRIELTDLLVRTTDALPDMPERSENRQIALINVRNIRAELKIEPKVRVPLEILPLDSYVQQLIDNNRAAIERLASVESLQFVPKILTRLTGARSTSRFDVHVVYEKKIDAAAERERLKKELDKIEKQLASAQARLGDAQFLSKAPAHVVGGLRKQVEELTILREKILAKLKESG